MSEPVRVAIFLSTLDNDYQTQQRDICRVASKRHGFSVRVLSAGNSADEQVRQVKECLAEPESVRPRALLVNPVLESLLRPLAEEAARLGVAFVVLNRSCGWIGELRVRHPRVPLFSVDPDQRKVGRIQGEQFARLLPAGGDLLYVCGTVGTSSAQIRLDGVRAALAGRNIHMVLAQGDWSSASGSAAVQHWLRTRITTVKACVVGAQNDTMAISARAALVSGALELKQPELMDVPVTGCDGTPAQGQACVRSHELRATVVIPSSADRAVDELASAFASGRSPEADIVLDVASFPDISSIESPKVPRATAQSFGPHSKASTARG